MKRILFVVSVLAAMVICTGLAAHADTFQLSLTSTYLASTCNSNGTICAGPDTGFLIVKNTGNTTFTGTMDLSGTSPGVGGFCPPTGTVDDHFSGSLAAGGSWTFALSTDSSNCGGFNGAAGALFQFTGTAGATGVSGNVNDSAIQSGIVNAYGTDAYVLQGGCPSGCDPGDAFELSQNAGHYTFTQTVGGAVPEPASLALLGTGLIGLAGRIRKRMK